MAQDIGFAQGARKPSAGETIRFNQVEAIAFSRSGSLLAYTRGRKISVLDVSARKGQSLSLTSPARITAIVFPRKESLLVTGDNAGKALVWDLSQKKSVKEIHVGDPIMSIDISPDGRLVAIGCRSGRVLLGDTDSWSLGELTPSHIYGTRSVGFTPDGRKLLSAGQDQTAHVYDTSGRAFSGYLSSGVMGIKAHMGLVNAIAGLAEDGRALTGAWCNGAAFIEDPPRQDATLRLWDLARSKPVKSMHFPYGVSRICAWLSGSSSRVFLLIPTEPFDYAYRGWGEIHSVDLTSWKSVKLFSDPNYPRSAITAIACSPDGLTLAAGTADGRVYLVDPETGEGLKPRTGDNASVARCAGE